MFVFGLTVLSPAELDIGIVAITVSAYALCENIPSDVNDIEVKIRVRKYLL